LLIYSKHYILFMHTTHTTHKIGRTILNVVVGVKMREPVKVGHDDGDGEGDAEHATDGAEGGHQFPS
jgi:hypothetical protein